MEQKRFRRGDRLILSRIESTEIITYIRTLQSGACIIVNNDGRIEQVYVFNLDKIQEHKAITLKKNAS